MTRYLTVADAAEEISVTDHAVLALIHRGELSASNVSLGSSRPRWRIASDELTRWLTSRETAPRITRRRRQTTAITEYV
jgi:excisionase family DNA binding protein